MDWMQVCGAQPARRGEDGWDSALPLSLAVRVNGEAFAPLRGWPAVRFAVPDQVGAIGVNRT